MMAVFFFIAREKGLKFHAQPQTGAYSCSDIPSTMQFLCIPKHTNQLSLLIR